MTTLNFPASPSVNDTYTANNTTWRWNGTAWSVVALLTSEQITTALTYTPENSANKGIGSGYASLDSSGIVPASQLPDIAAVTFTTTGGATAGATYTGATAVTVDYSTLGAAPANHTHSYQAADADLLAIGGLTGTSGFLKKTAADTWALDTSTYLTAEADTLQTVTARGAVTTTAVTFSGGITGNLTGNAATATDATTATNVSGGLISLSRLNPRISSAATGTSLTPNVDAADQYVFTALASALTINAPTGTPLDGNKLMFRLLDNGTARAITWNGTYTAIGVTLPATTVASKTTYVGCIYNANNTRWDVIAVATQV